MQKFLSTGGLGDAFIVILKILEKKQNEDFSQFNWKHVESSNIFEPFKILSNRFLNESDEIEFEYDPKYIENIQKIHAKDRDIIPTPVVGICNFYKKSLPLNNPFLIRDSKEKKYDIVLQSSGGFQNNRKWNVHPSQIASILSAMGRHVTIVGTDKNFYQPTKEPHKILNLVGRTNLNDVLDIIERCEVYIGLSGLLNYFACASRITNIHLIESSEHEISYYHPLWKKYSTGIKYGALTEIISALK